MPTVLVTGATGLVGSHVARLLVERGDEVRVTTRTRSKLDNLAGLDVGTARADILDRRSLRRALRGVDRLFHVAGLTSGVAPPSVKLRVRAALAFASAAEALPGRPPITTVEACAASQWWTYRSAKAKRELGWKPSHHEDTLERTVAWYRDRGVAGLARPGTGRPLALRVAGFGLRRANEVVDRLTL